MVEPLSLTIKLVQEVLESLSEVRSNHEECARLGRLAKQTLKLVNQIQSKFVAVQSVSESISYINEALEGAQAAIDNCYNTDCLCALLLRRTHSLELKNAEKELDRARLQIPLASLEITLNIQDMLAASADGKSHETFSEKTARTHQTKTLKTAIEEVTNRINQGFDKVSARTNQAIGEASTQPHQEIKDVKNEIGQLMQRLSLHLETSGILVPTSNLVNEISCDATKAKTNKEECNQLARLAEQALQFLKTLKENTLSHSLVLVALNQLNEALASAKQSLADCCATNVFLGAIFHQSYSLRVKEAMKELESALSQIPFALEGIPTRIQSTFLELCSERDNAKVGQSIATYAQGDDLLDEQPRDNVEASQPSQDNNGQSSLHGVSSNSFDTTKVCSYSNLT